MEEAFLRLFHGYFDLIPATIREYQDGHWVMGTIFAITAAGSSLIIWPVVFITIPAIFSRKKPKETPVVKTSEQELREWAEMQYLIYGKIIPTYNREKYLQLPAHPVLALPPARND